MGLFRIIAVRWFVPLLLATAASNAYALQLDTPLVETGWLAGSLDQVVVLDVRKDDSSFAGKPVPRGKLKLKKLTGHIPGAVSVPWKKVSVKRKEGDTVLKGMLPEATAFEALMRASGVNDDSALVIAGRGATAKEIAFATRLYWTLKYFGHDNVALLNGGTAKWTTEGRLLSHEKGANPQGSFTVRDQRDRLLATTEDVERAIAQGDIQLLDCRPEYFFHGLTYKKGFVPASYKGHLPGAKTFPHVLLADNFGPATFFRAEELRKVAELKGIELYAPTIAYCNTGVEASLAWYVLHELAGNKDVKLYDGSMHEWSTNPPEHQVVSLMTTSTMEPAVAAGEPAIETVEPAIATLKPVQSLQSLIEERRDEMRRRREQRIDAITDHNFYRPHWIVAREAAMDDYRDSIRALHRNQRDAARLLHQARRSFYDPWSQALRNRSEIRRYTSQLAHLDRQEHLDNLMLSHRYDPFGYYR